MDGSLDYNCEELDKNLSECILDVIEDANKKDESSEEEMLKMLNLYEEKEDHNKSKDINNIFLFDDEERVLIKNTIEDLFKELNYNYICLSKVLGRIFTLNESIASKYKLNELNIKNYLEYNYDYYITDKFVGKDVIKNERTIITEYFKNADTVTKKDLMEFFEKIGYKNTQSYNKYYSSLSLLGFIMISEEAIISTGATAPVV